MNPPDAFYFGCIDRLGHYFWTPALRHDWYARQQQPWGEHVDSVLCPGTTVDDRGKGQRYIRTPENQPEGQAALHHKDGWTALAFWDRSVDRRGGCNSVFILRGTLTFEEAVAAARTAFPSVWARFKFEVRA